MVDLATRYCSAVVIKNKCDKTIVQALFVSWITIFGALRQFFSDNRGEFSNETMRCLGDGYDIKLVAQRRKVHGVTLCVSG